MMSGSKGRCASLLLARRGEVGSGRATPAYSLQRGNARGRRQRRCLRFRASVIRGADSARALRSGSVSPRVLAAFPPVHHARASFGGVVGGIRSRSWQGRTTAAPATRFGRRWRRAGTASGVGCGRPRAPSRGDLRASGPELGQVIFELAAGTGETGFAAARAIGPGLGRLTGTYSRRDGGGCAARVRAPWPRQRRTASREWTPSVSTSTTTASMAALRRGPHADVRSGRCACGDPARAARRRAAVAVGVGRR